MTARTADRGLGRALKPAGRGQQGDGGERRASRVGARQRQGADPQVPVRRRRGAGLSAGELSEFVKTAGISQETFGRARKELAERSSVECFQTKEVRRQDHAASLAAGTAGGPDPREGHQVGDGGWDADRTRPGAVDPQRGQAGRFARDDRSTMAALRRSCARHPRLLMCARRAHLGRVSVGTPLRCSPQ